MFFLKTGNGLSWSHQPVGLGSESDKSDGQMSDLSVRLDTKKSDKVGQMSDSVRPLNTVGHFLSDFLQFYRFSINSVIFHILRFENQRFFAFFGDFVLSDTLSD